MTASGCRFRFLILAALTGLPSLAGAAEIQGTAIFRERLALPPKAVFEATLEDVSRADAPGTIIGQTRIDRPKNPPISFRIPFDRQDYDARHRYVVRARITVDGRAMFVTEQPPRVLERGVDHNVALVLVRATREPAAGTIPRLPADFTGMSPCANCAGTRHTLRLMADQSYWLATTQLRTGQDVTTWERGNWDLSSDRRLLRLDRERGAGLDFAVLDANTLRPVDGDGERVDDANDLRRARELAPLQPRGRMRGMYRSDGASAWFMDCATGAKLAVSPDGDQVDLERAYLRDRRESDGELQVAVEGRIESRARAEGIGQEPVLIVERFLETKPGELCGGGRVVSPLEGTRWVPTRVGTTQARTGSGSREPFIHLESGSGRVTVFGGCNRFTASYQRNAESLRFDGIRSTTVPCPSATFDEQGFFDALQATRSWRVMGNVLELFDRTGARLARFEARDL